MLHQLALLMGFQLIGEAIVKSLTGMSPAWSPFAAASCHRPQRKLK